MTKYLLFLGVLLCAFCFLKLLFARSKLYILSWKLPGPLAFPLIGNALIFLCKTDDLFERIVNVFSKYPSPMRLWFGPKFTIIFAEAEQAAKVLSSTNFSYKDDVYKFLKGLNGEGLITGSGPKWKKDRKLMSPLFGKKYVAEYFSVICHHTNILLEKLEAETDKVTFNIEEYLHRCCTDFVNESIIGVKTDAQNGNLESLLHAVNRIYESGHVRIVKVWLQIDWIFKLTHYYKEQIHDLNEIHGFLRNVVRANEENRLHNGTLLDRILDIKNEFPDFATEDELVHHMSTLYTASEDTVMTIGSFALLLFGMYPEIQQRVVNEIIQKIGHESNLNLDDLSKLDYLEMCIKDVLRLFPIAPFIMRTSAEDYQIGEITIPKGCSVLIAIHNIHRSPKHWEKPNEFYPEHFLPDVVKKRHPYAFLSFSAGPRGCLGKFYSYMAMKIMLILIVRKFEIYADGKIGDIRLKTDISVRPINRQFPVRIKLRK